MEALDAIFGSVDFTLTSPTTCTVKLVPNPGDDTDDKNHVQVTLDVTFPATYPEIAPEVTVNLDKGLVRDQLAILDSLVATVCEENLGMPTIFTVAEAVREWLVEHNEKGCGDESMHGQMMRRAQEAAKQKVMDEKVFEEQQKKEGVGETEKREMEIRKKREEGTPCTRANFLAWKAKYDEEMAEVRAADLEKAKEDKRLAAMAERKAGYDYFVDQGSLDDLERMADEALEAEVTEAEIDEGLFEDSDDDLDDLDFDEEEEEEEPDI